MGSSDPDTDPRRAFLRSPGDPGTGARLNENARAQEDWRLFARTSPWAAVTTGHADPDHMQELIKILRPHVPKSALWPLQRLILSHSAPNLAARRVNEFVKLLAPLPRQLVELNLLRGLQRNANVLDAVRRMALQLERAGRRKEAIEIFRKCVVFCPDQANASLNLATLLRADDRAPSAVKPFHWGGVISNFRDSIHEFMICLRNAGAPVARYRRYFQACAHLSPRHRMLHREIVRQSIHQIGSANAADIAASHGFELSGHAALKPAPIAESGSAPIELRAAWVVNDFDRLTLSVNNVWYHRRDETPATNEKRSRVIFAEDVIDRHSRAFLGGYARNFYHWMVQVSRNLKFYVDAGLDMPILDFGPTLLPFQAAVYEAAGLIDRVSPSISRPCLINVERLLVSPWLFFAPGAERRHLDWLRGLFIDGPSPGPERIYISRGRQRHRRRLANEQELIDIVVAHGFEVVELGARPFAEEVRFLSNARCIVGAHGAGLANILFGRPSGTMVELAPANVDLHYYRELARELEWQFIRLEGETTDRPDAPRLAADQQIRIDPDKLRRILSGL